MFKMLLMTTALAVAGVSAEAATVTIDVTGIIDSGYDSSGIFGASDASLNGLTASLKLVFDMSKGVRTTNADGDNLAFSPLYPDLGNPFVSSSVTVNGLTHSFAAAERFGADLYQPSGSSSDVRAYDDVYFGGYYFNGVSVSQLWDLFSDVPEGLESSFAYDPAKGPSYASFGIVKLNPDETGFELNTFGSVSITRGTYTVSGIEPPISAVPLPASLPLLLAGIGGLAGLGRRRRAA